jgi:hypothetical protein
MCARETVRDVFDWLQSLSGLRITSLLFVDKSMPYSPDSYLGNYPALFYCNRVV